MIRRLQQIAAVYRFTGRAMRLVWATSAPLFVMLLGTTLLAGAIPAVMAWVGAQLVDSVVHASTGAAAVGIGPLGWLSAEAVLVVTLSATSRALDLCQSLLRAQLGHKVNVLILEKALDLDLEQFEDSETYDRMTRARREASTRPLSLVRRAFGLARNGVTLLTYGALLLAFSPWAVLLLVVASVPSFFAETRFAGEAFRLFRWRSPEKRRQAYLEMVVAREDYAKEVMLLGIGPTLVGWYDDIFKTLYAEDRNLTLRRGAWGFLLGMLSVLALYGAYAWVVWAAVAAAITIGQMTMYLVVFRQGQGAFTASLEAVGGMYEDNLYLSNLYEFLEMPVRSPSGTGTVGPDPSDGVRFEGVSFTYPGASAPALRGVDLHVPPGRKLALVGHNGSGKTTLIKLLTRLYLPSEGRITLDGLPLEEWSLVALRERVGVIFQDFVRYQLTVGENIGVGSVQHLHDEAQLDAASDKGMALPFIDELPDRYATQLGRWFSKGRELSTGQWQKVALSRAFMRTDANLLVLDEPTAAMDAEAEAMIFQRLADLADDRMAILISHRFSTVRMADHIVVLDHGAVVERGTHEELMEQRGAYHRLFSLQAKGYR